MTDPIKLVQAHELLQAVREEHSRAGMRTESTDEAHNHGRCSEAADIAADAVFNVLNCQASYLHDPESQAAMRDMLTPADAVSS